MAGNPRDHVKDKGFWDGGTRHHGTNDESSGRAKGFPGDPKPSNAGVRIDLDAPRKKSS